MGFVSTSNRGAFKEKIVMRKLLVASLALAIVAGFAMTVSAQSTIFLDVRNNGAGIQSISTPLFPFTNGQDGSEVATNGGGAGDGQVLRLNPTVSNNFHTHPTFGRSWPNLDGDNNLSTGSLHAFMAVSEDLSGTGDVISSVGVDFNVTENLPDDANRIASLSWAWDAANWAGTNAGINNGASNGANPPSWLGAKAVKVPVNASAQYDTAGGLVPSATPYHLGELRVTAGPRTPSVPGLNNHRNRSTFNVRMSVNDLLITRVFQTGGDATEMVSFGYSAGSPETAVSGSQVGATSTAPDGVVVIQMKGDASGDGAVLGGDIGGFAPAFNAGTALKQSQAFIWNGDPGASPQVLGSDIGIFAPAFNSPNP
jgi:hypothetical protein